MGGKFWYWGGFTDLERSLNRRGCKVVTAAVGPFSSVWDRAVELFYQIKGGTVDYGKEHSARHGHARFGRTFPGLYPAWDAQHPVHLVGHSMGGLTARCLVQLLSDNGRTGGEEGLFGAAPHAPGQAPGQAQMQEDGQGGEGFAYIRPASYLGSAVGSSWVLSVTCIACPHDGTPMVDILDRWMDRVFDAMCYANTITPALSPSAEQQIFDFKLDQWGVHPRQAHESWKQYSARVSSAPVFKNKPLDLCHHDLSLLGAAQLNSWVRPAKDVLYLSFSCCTTYSNWLTGTKHVPLVATNPLFLLSAAVLGSVQLKEELELSHDSQDAEHRQAGEATEVEAGGGGGKGKAARDGAGRGGGRAETETEWRRNDGMVSSCSQRAPTRAYKSEDGARNVCVNVCVNGVSSRLPHSAPEPAPGRGSRGGPGGQGQGPGGEEGEDGKEGETEGQHGFGTAGGAAGAHAVAAAGADGECACAERGGEGGGGGGGGGGGETGGATTALQPAGNSRKCTYSIALVVTNGFCG